MEEFSQDLSVALEEANQQDSDSCADQVMQKSRRPRRRRVRREHREGGPALAGGGTSPLSRSDDESPDRRAPVLQSRDSQQQHHRHSKLVRTSLARMQLDTGVHDASGAIAARLPLSHNLPAASARNCRGKRGSGRGTAASKRGSGKKEEAAFFSLSEDMDLTMCDDGLLLPALDQSCATLHRLRQYTNDTETCGMFAATEDGDCRMESVFSTSSSDLASECGGIAGANSDNANGSGLCGCSSEADDEQTDFPQSEPPPPKIPALFVDSLSPPSERLRLAAATSMCGVAAGSTMSQRGLNSSCVMNGIIQNCGLNVLRLPEGHRTRIVGSCSAQPQKSASPASSLPGPSSSSLSSALGINAIGTVPTGTLREHSGAATPVTANRHHLSITSEFRRRVHSAGNRAAVNCLEQAVTRKRRRRCCPLVTTSGGASGVSGSAAVSVPGSPSVSDSSPAFKHSATNVMGAASISSHCFARVTEHY